MQITIGLITGPFCPDVSIFGRSLLERLLLQFQRIGLQSFVIESSDYDRKTIRRSLGILCNQPGIKIVESFDDLLSDPDCPDQSSGYILIPANLVLSKSSAAAILQGNPPLSALSSGNHNLANGELAVGTLGDLLDKRAVSPAPVSRAVRLIRPIFMDDTQTGAAKAELELARSVHEDTIAKDAMLARLVDRKLSWRLSYRLARTRCRANQITVANTLLGMLSAWMFTIPNYWTRVGASLIFLLVTTLDGVDGELARLKLGETEFGANLDVTTDALVNFAVILGIILGCYRETHTRHYLLLLPVFVGGFSLCAVMSYIAVRACGNNPPSWLFERLTSRDFAYILVIFAAVHRLDIVAWGASFVSYVVAFILFLLVVSGGVRQSSLPRV